jgi:hypothetical protein
VSGGLFGWIGDGLAEIASEVIGVFKSDDAASNSGATQARTNRGSQSSNSGETHARSIDGSQRAGGASNGKSAWSQAFKFDPNTDDVNTKLTESGCKEKAGIYLIRDENDERSLYVGKAEGTSQDILSRVKTHLTGEGNSGIRERIEKGETLTIRWVECDNPEQYESVAMAYLLPTDNNKAEYLGAERTRIQEEIAIGILLDVPSFWHENYEKMVEEAKEQGLSVARYGSNRVEVAEAIFWQCNEETIDSDSKDGSDYGSSDYGSKDYGNNSDSNSGSSGNCGSGGEALLGGLISSLVVFFGDRSKSESSVTSDHSRGDYENSGDSWFGNWFGDSSDSESSVTSDHSRSDSENNGDSWFGNWFDDSSESESSNASDSSSINSNSRDSSDYGSSDYGSGDYGDSGDSDSSSSSSDSGGSDYGSSDYGSGDDGDSGGSDSSSSSSDSGDSDYGSSDYGSGDYGDSSGSDSSSSSSDSWW